MKYYELAFDENKGKPTKSDVPLNVSQHVYFIHSSNLNPIYKEREFGLFFHWSECFIYLVLLFSLAVC